MKKPIRYSSHRSAVAIVLSLALLVFVSAPIRAAATTVTLNPVADTTVKQASPTTNYGSATPLYVQGTDYKATYMKFDLSSLAGKTITSATLKIHTLSDGGSAETQNISLNTDASWSESSLTYNNSINGSNSGLKPSTQIGSIKGAAGSSTISVTLNASTVSSKAGGLFSFVMTPANTTTTDEIKFLPREDSTNKPQLVVDIGTTTATATPTKAATATPTKPAIATPTKTPTPKPGTPTMTPSKTPTPKPGTPTVTPTRTPTPGATATPNPNPTACAISQPTNLSPQGSIVAIGNSRFTWDPVPGATSYALRIDDTADPFAFTYAGGVCKATNSGDMCTDSLTTNTFQFPLVPGHTYKWWVHAINSCNTWSLASEVTLTILTASPTPTAAPTATVMPTSEVSPTTDMSPSPTAGPTCPKHANGDANCDGQTDFIDFEIWRQESMGEATTKTADFNDDGTVDFVDFEIWRQGYFDESPAATPTESVSPTPTCMPRPACLDSEPRCEIAEPVAGWCVASTPTPSPVISCTAPVECAAPPAGCSYQGATQCTCGTLVCANQ